MTKGQKLSDFGAGVSKELKALNLEPPPPVKKVEKIDVLKAYKASKAKDTSNFVVVGMIILGFLVNCNLMDFLQDMSMRGKALSWGGCYTTVGPWTNA